MASTSTWRGRTMVSSNPSSLQKSAAFESVDTKYQWNHSRVTANRTKHQAHNMTFGRRSSHLLWDDNKKKEKKKNKNKYTKYTNKKNKNKYKKSKKNKKNNKKKNNNKQRKPKLEETKTNNIWCLGGHGAGEGHHVPSHLLFPDSQWSHSRDGEPQRPSEDLPLGLSRKTQCRMVLRCSNPKKEVKEHEPQDIHVSWRLKDPLACWKTWNSHWGDDFNFGIQYDLQLH